MNLIAEGNFVAIFHSVDGVCFLFPVFACGWRMHNDDWTKNEEKNWNEKMATSQFVFHIQFTIDIMNFRYKRPLGITNFFNVPTYSVLFLYTSLDISNFRYYELFASPLKSVISRVHCSGISIDCCEIMGLSPKWNLGCPRMVGDPEDNDNNIQYE